MLALLPAMGAGQSLSQFCLPVICNPAVQSPCAAIYTDPAMPITTMLWTYLGGPMDCAFPAPNGLHHITLRFVEPNKTAAGQRVMTLRVNNGLPVTLDVFAAAGGAKRLLELTIPVVVVDSLVRVALRARAGNVMLSDAVIELVAAQTTAEVVDWLRCGKPVDLDSTCANLDRVWLREPGSGAVREYFAVPVPFGGQVPVLTWRDNLVWPPVN